MLDIKRISLGAILTGLLLLVAVAGLPNQRPVEAAVVTWKANLVGAQEVPPVPVGFGSATAEFFFNDAPQERTLIYFVTLSGVNAADVTGAHIHRAIAGVNGPIIHPFKSPDGADKGVTYFAGQLKLSEADVADLKAGGLYVNVHSSAKPGGFARAQIYLPGGAAEASTRAAVKAWNDKNIAGFLAGWTDAGLMQEFEAPRAELAKFLGEFIGDPPIVLRSITNVTQSASTASARVELAFGAIIEPSQVGFALKDGVWQLDSFVDQPAAIPAGVTAVDLSLQEYAFVYNKAAAAGGNIAFRVKNTGKEDHEVGLVKLAAGVNIFDAIQSENEPEGIEMIGFGGPYDPGQETTVVFTQALAAGRYALVCFIESPAGVPHAFLGMLSEFTVSGGGSVTPPRTGDGGLLTSQSDELSLSLLLLGASAMVAGLGGLAVAVRRAR